jgi:hypothetical protein
MHLNWDTLKRNYLGIAVFTKVWPGFREPQGSCSAQGHISTQGQRGKKRHNGQKLKVEQAWLRGMLDRRQDFEL